MDHRFSTVSHRGFFFTALALLAGAGGGVDAQTFSKDVKYTIALLNFENVGHVKKSKEARDYLKKTGLKDNFYLIHNENQSTIFYGGYKAIDSRENPDEATRAKEDLRNLVAFRIGDETPFQGAVFVAVPSPDPLAPAEWDARNAKGVWSVQVAAFKDSADRKEAAVDAVKEFRKRGVEAYFYHGPTTSSVLLGAFPQEALVGKTPEFKAAPTKELVVVPFRPPSIPEEVTQADGTQSKVIAPEWQVNDPLLMALMKDYPRHAVNGYDKLSTVKDPKTGQVEQKYAESFVVDLREVRKQSLLSVTPSNNLPAQAEAPAPGTLAPRPQTPGSGLKSIK